jgi:IPT/TIG domain/FG-GAP repeat
MLVSNGRLQPAAFHLIGDAKPLLARPRSWALAVVAVLSLLLVAGLYQRLDTERSTTLTSGRPIAAQPVGLLGLPVAAQGPVSAALGAASRGYRVGASSAGLQVANHAQHLRALFGREGVKLQSGAVEEQLRLRAVGYGRSLTAVGDPVPRVESNRVVFARTGLTEWYANGPLGLEQGFTIARAPSTYHTGALTLSMALSGNARAELISSGRGVKLSHAGSSLRYAGLLAEDSRGRGLHTWLELNAGKLLLRVDVRGARYPLRIDPLVQQAKLQGSGEVGNGRFARSVALSAYGNTALIGGPRDSGNRGTVWVFTRSGSTWTQQAKLESGENGKQSAHLYFGRGVALSADGNTVLIGDRGSRRNIGAAWVFTRSGSTWTQRAKLEGSGEIGAARFGSPVSLSADGGTALIGGYADDGRVGAAWVFTGSGSTWTQQAKLEGGGELGRGQFGRSVALSGDGDSALIGGFTDHHKLGAAWIFTRSGSTWTQQTKLQAGGELGRGEFGRSVALSGDGGTALIGGFTDNGAVGAAWVFTGSGSTWTQQTELEGGGEAGSGEFGHGAALSADGNTALIGGSTDEGGLGAAWIFTRANGLWTQQGSKLAIGKESAVAGFGWSVALSAEGSTALIGGFATGGDVGAAWVFGPPAPSVTHVDPNQGPVAGGTSVTITGSGFTDVSYVSFGAIDATDVNVESPTRLTAISPAGSGTVDVTVATPGNISATSAADQFSYVAPPGTGTGGEPESKGKDQTANAEPTGPPAASGTVAAGVLPFLASVVPPPVLGVSGNVAPVSGRVLIRLPGTSGFVLLTSLRQVPFGTVIDATHGSVSVTTAAPRGGTQTGIFFGGRFLLRQGRNGLVVAVLVGGNFGVCPTARERRHLAHASSSHASSKHVVRKLWANAHGSFSTKGNYAAGAVQGTEWLTEDRCDGTLIRVTRDKVKVTDLVRHRNRIVHVGHRYLVKAP